MITRYKNKWYMKIPCGEVQYGCISRRITIWFRGKRLR